MQVRNEPAVDKFLTAYTSSGWKEKPPSEEMQTLPEASFPLDALQLKAGLSDACSWELEERRVSESRALRSGITIDTSGTAAALLTSERLRAPAASRGELGASGPVYRHKVAAAVTAIKSAPLQKKGLEGPGLT